MSEGNSNYALIFMIWDFLFLSASGKSAREVRKSALVVAPGSGSETQAKAYPGLARTRGARKSAATPDLVVGVRSLKVKSNDRVNNRADLSARFTFAEGLSFDSLRLSHVGGKRDILGNIGVGYSFASKSFLTTSAAQGAYSRAGIDYKYGSDEVLPYLERLSADKPKNIKGGLGCNSPDPNFYVPGGAGVGDFCNYNFGG